MAVFSWVACLIALGAALASAMRLQRVGVLVRTDPAALARVIRRPSFRSPQVLCLSELAREAGAEREAELLGDIARMPDERSRAALVNEHLRDLARELGWGERIPLAAGRASLFGAFCLLFFDLAGRGAGFGSLVTILGWGGAGLLAARLLGARADRMARQYGEAVDEMITAAVAAMRRVEGAC
jgi:hypothetical protein